MREAWVQKLTAGVPNAVKGPLLDLSLCKRKLEKERKGKRKN